MDILNNLLSVEAPTGLWANIINWMDGGIAHYAVVIILLTLIIKLVMLPFDFYNKYVTKKNTMMITKLQPELEKISNDHRQDDRGGKTNRDDRPRRKLGWRLPAKTGS